MRALLIIFIISIIVSSCDKNNVEPVILTDGTFTGNFYRSSPNAKYQASDVTIVFKDNTFEGGGSIAKYPAICSGTFKNHGKKIEFSNSCIWTAEFDWTFILGGEFNISTKGEEIILKRSYGEETYDTYTLRKQ